MTDSSLGSAHSSLDRQRSSFSPSYHDPTFYPYRPHTSSENISPRVTDRRDHHNRFSAPTSTSRALDSSNVRSGSRQGVGCGDGLSEEDDDTVSSNLSGT